MSWWLLLLDTAGVALVCVLLYGIALVVRRRVLSRRGGTFEMSCRLRPSTSVRGWLLGLGRYSGDSLEFFRIFSLAPRAKQAWRRQELEYSSRREPVGGEQVSLYAGHVVVICHTPSGETELAMSPRSLVGFQAWLEAAPPGAAEVI